MVALTGRAEAYYSDTSGDPQEIIAVAKYGYLFQGQHYSWQRKPRGMPGLDLDPSCFVNYLQNHDQVANSARGLRGHQLTSPARWRAMTAVLLLLPGTPMLFQGQEFSASAPFLFFVDFDDALSAAVRKGRAEFLMQFPSVVDYVAVAELADPASDSTFERCKLDFAERTRHAAAYALHRDLLALRRSSAGAAPSGAPYGGRHRPVAARLCDSILRRPTRATIGCWWSISARTWTASRSPIRWWRRRKAAAGVLEWSSEHPNYGGGGTPDIWATGAWSVPGEIALVFAPRARTDERGHRR